MEKVKTKMDDPKEVISNGDLNDGPTKAKLIKRSNAEIEKPPAIELKFNTTYLDEEFIEMLAEQWLPEFKDDFKDEETGVQVFTDPFQICLIPNFLKNKACARALVDEIVKKVTWSRKQMDLYEFYQSTDLSNLVHCKLLTSFLQVLRRDVRPWLEQVTNLKLDYVSASCSMYTVGDYLLVHDDLLKDRQVAFIYYLSPWEGVEEWQESHGGCLEIFNSDDQCFPQFPVRRKIPPVNNRFACFKVGARSFHQVGEVTTYDYPRLTINGWFHGASNDEEVVETLRPITRLVYQPPLNTDEIDLNTWINGCYLKPSVRMSIQKRIEDISETCLYEFLNNDLYKEATDQLLNDDTLVWRRKGPANAQNYEILDLNSASNIVKSLIALFSSQTMFELLRDYTDLDLAGENTKTPGFSLELQRWSHGNYTVLGDGAHCEDCSLDVLYYLNADKGAGVVTYLSPDVEDTAQLRSNGIYHAEEDSDCSGSDDGSVLLTVKPVDNSLNMIYCCEDTVKFTKYVSHNTPFEKGPVFMLACSYKE